MKDEEENEEVVEKPPFLGSWKNIYWLLMGNLVALIILFYLFTLYFS